MRSTFALLVLPTLLQAQSPSERFSAIEKRMGCRLGISALDTAQGRRLEYRAEERFPLCSTFKLLLAAAFLKRVDQGKDGLDRTVTFGPDDLLEWAPVARARVMDGSMSVADLCVASIQQSDNTAANLLLKRLGGPEAFTAYVRTLGDTITRLDRTEPALNSAIQGDVRDTTTPRAMIQSMHQVLLGQHLSPTSRIQLEVWLAAVQSGAGRLRAGLPETWQLGHKTGSGDQGTTNDIAIVRPTGRAPILICAYLTECKAPVPEREAALAEAARVIAMEFR